MFEGDLGKAGEEAAQQHQQEATEQASLQASATSRQQSQACQQTDLRDSSKHIPARSSPAAGAAVGPAGVPPCLANSLSALPLSSQWWSAAATAGLDAGRPSQLAQDPLVAAWAVTRAPPRIPVRGYSPPPTRTACRLVVAQEMAA
jgi:hypothetical protein